MKRILSFSHSKEGSEMRWGEIGSKGWVVLLGMISLLFFVGLTTGVAWSDNSLCLGCHQDEALTKKDAHGRNISLSVSEADFKNSTHGGLSCSDCHTHIKDEKHAEGGEAVDKSVNC